MEQRELTWQYKRQSRLRGVNVAWSQQTLHSHPNFVASVSLSILMIAESQKQKFALTYFHVFPSLGVVLLPHDGRGRPPLPNLVP